LDHHDCSGCGLCLLVCPVWREARDMRFTPKGRARAIQHGATRADLAASVAGCTLCGACEPACPEELPLVDMVLGLRRDAACGNGTCHLAPGDGAEISAALARGEAIEPSRLEAFLAPLRETRRIVVADGLLLRFLRRWLPAVEVIGLGESLLPEVRGKLGPRDLYVVDSQAYNLDQERLAGRYDALRAASGCHLNLDLQRIAEPAAGQGAWLLEGRDVDRIVVENPADREAFAFSGKPVVHVAELA
jgi:NAD-dependent dihydropyrimidine dehydrogenase PreA subunit